MICARECAREPTAKEIGLSQVAGSTRCAHRSESYEKRHSTKGPGSRACVCHPSLERHPSRRYNIVCIRIAIKCGLRLTGGELGSVAWPAGDLVNPHNQGCLKIIASDTTGVLPASLRRNSEVWRREGAKPAAHVLRTARRRRQSHRHQNTS